MLPVQLTQRDPGGWQTIPDPASPKKERNEHDGKIETACGDVSCDSNRIRPIVERVLDVWRFSPGRTLIRQSRMFPDKAAACGADADYQSTPRRVLDGALERDLISDCIGKPTRRFLANGHSDTRSHQIGGFCRYRQLSFAHNQFADTPGTRFSARGSVREANRPACAEDLSVG